MKGGEKSPIRLDENGKGTFKGVAGKFYRVHVQSEVTPEQVDELFDAYGGLTKELESWLRSEWEGFKPQWSQQSASSSLLAAGNGLLAGSWAAIEGVWDSIGLIGDILKDPAKFAERLGGSGAALADLAQKSPELMEKALLLASEEAEQCLLLRTASLWMEALPKSQVGGTTA